MRKKFAYNPESDHLHPLQSLALHSFPSRFVVAVQCSDISIKVYSFILTLHRVAWSELSWPGAKMKVAATGAYWCLLVPTGAY